MDAKFGFGNLVYFFNNADRRGVVVGIRLYPGEIKYEVQWSDSTFNSHYDFELSLEKPVLEDNAVVPGG